METKAFDTVSQLASLEHGLEKIWGQPAERLNLAEEYFKIAAQPGSLDLQSHILAYQRAIKLDPFNGRYRKRFAEFKHEMGLLSEAIKEYQSALEFWQDWHELRLLYVEALLDDGQYVLAQKEIDSLNQAVPENRRVNYAQIELLLRNDGKNNWQKGV